MKALFSIFVCFIATLSVNAQTDSLNRLDSLQLASEFGEALIVTDRMLSRANDTDIPKLRIKKAEVLINLVRIPDAEKELSLLPTGLAGSLEAHRLSVTGYLNLNKGRHDLALEDLQKAYDLFVASGQQASREAARCLSYLSLAYFASGKYNQAADNAMIALQVREGLYGKTHEEVAASLNDLGLVYSRIDPDRALEYYDRALPIYERIHGKDHAKIAIINSNMGAIYRQMKLYGDATTNFETALAIWKKLYPNGHPNEAFVMRNLGQTYVNMGKHPVAYQYFEKSLKVYRQVYGTKHPDIASLLNQIAVVQLSDQKYLASLATLQDAIQANVPGTVATDPYQPISLNSYYNSRELLYSLQQKARAFEGLHFGKTLKVTDLRASLQNLFLCDTLIDDIRHHSTDETDKLFLGALASEVYEDGVRVSMAMSEAVVNPQLYLEHAFYFAEKSKSAVLQESIADSQAKEFAGIPSSLVSQEKELKASIALLSQRLSQKPEPDEEKYLRESIFQLNREYDAFIARLEKDFPGYYNLKFNYGLPRVTDLQQLLKEDQAIVSYFVAEQNQRLYQFTITKKSFKVRSNSLPVDFEKLAKGFVNGIYYRNFPAYQKAVSGLTKLLTPRVPTGIKELVIIPSGRLGTLPFDALPAHLGDGFRSTQYLAQRFSIGYEFSIGLITQKRGQGHPSSDPSIFLCAPIEFPNNDLNALPGTESEVVTISKLFGENRQRTSLRADANESAVKSGGLKEYNYLHFATHGIVDEQEPEQSRIFLQGLDHEDGNLFAGEIYNLSLNANLAVLSACQTGLGKYSKGEGVIGLSRALVYAGARNIIVSFWSVSDESTSQLMVDFYQTLLSQPEPRFGQALQAAKKKMIATGKYPEPYYWAPFVLIGF